VTGRAVSSYGSGSDEHDSAESEDSDSDCDSFNPNYDPLKLLELMEEIGPILDDVPDPYVLVLAGSRFDSKNKLFSDYWDYNNWKDWDPNDDESYMGPKCKLCKKSIITEGLNIVYKDICYWIYFDYSHVNVNENSRR
jgi:hypothetical protein